MTQFSAPGSSGGISHRWLALGAITLALVCIGLDQTVLNLALPTLSSSLHASESELQWFVSSYTLALAAAMLPAGLLGDRYGRKTVLLTALVVFGVMSVACAFAPSSTAFIAARTVLGRGRSRSHRHVSLRRDGALPGVGAAACHGHLGCRQLPCAAPRADRRRLRPGPFLVGLGLPDECPGNPDRPDRRAPLRAAVEEPSGGPASTSPAWRCRAPVSPP